jgi:hypothetical protein
MSLPRRCCAPPPTRPPRASAAAGLSLEAARLSGGGEAVLAVFRHARRRVGARDRWRLTRGVGLRPRRSHSRAGSRASPDFFRLVPPGKSIPEPPHAPTAVAVIEQPRGSPQPGGRRSQPRPACMRTTPPWADPASALRAAHAEQPRGGRQDRGGGHQREGTYRESLRPASPKGRSHAPGAV